MELGTALLLSIANGLVVGAVVYTVLSIQTNLKRRRIRAYRWYRVGISLGRDPASESIENWYIQASRNGRERWVARRVVAAYERTVKSADSCRTIAELAERQMLPNGLEGVL